MAFVSFVVDPTANQNIILNPKRIDRSLPATVLVIRPKPALPNCPVGSP